MNPYQENPVSTGTIVTAVLATAVVAGIGVYLFTRPKAAAPVQLPAPTPANPVSPGTAPVESPSPVQPSPTITHPLPNLQPTWQQLDPSRGPIVLQAGKTYRFSVAADDLGMLQPLIAQVIPTRVNADATWPDASESNRARFQVTMGTAFANAPSIPSLRVWQHS